MVCPRCRNLLSPGSQGVCPGCGTPLTRVTSGVLKTSAVMIAADGESQIYRSVSDVPARLRRALQESTSGENSAIILIADRRGKEEIAKTSQPVPALPPPPPVAHRERTRLSFNHWIGIAITFASGAMVWILYSRYW